MSHWDDPDIDPEVSRHKLAWAERLKVPVVLWTPDQVNETIYTAADLFHDRWEQGELPHETLFVGLLNGATPFTQPLMRDITLAGAERGTFIDPRIDYIDVSRFGNSQTGSEEVTIERNLKRATWHQILTGKVQHIELLDDVIDEGVTSRLLREDILATIEHARNHPLLAEFVTADPSEISFGITALVRKRIPQEGMGGFERIHGLLEGPASWLGGMGMDGKDEKYRHLPMVVVAASQDERYREDFAHVIATQRQNGFQESSVVNEQCAEALWLPPKPKELKSEDDVPLFDVDVFLEQVFARELSAVA